MFFSRSDELIRMQKKIASLHSEDVNRYITIYADSVYSPWIRVKHVFGRIIW